MTGLAVTLLLLAGAVALPVVSGTRPGRRPRGLLPAGQGPEVSGSVGASPGRSVTGPAATKRGVADPALMLELLAAMLEAGRPLIPALGILADLADPVTGPAMKRLAAGLELGMPWTEAWALAVGREPGTRSSRPGRSRTGGRLPELHFALSYAAVSGAPAAKVLLAQAGQLRRRRRRAHEAAAAVLGVRLVLPLGLCTLPAFAALTVLPLVLSLLPGLG